MRSPIQILAIPYRYVGGELEVCVFHRANVDQWQFVSGGAEDDETPEAAARREIWEETGISAEPRRLTSMCHISADIYSPAATAHWPHDLHVVPEYSFAFACPDEIVLSPEHTDCVWMPAAEARARLTWDSNRTALYELECRLRDGTLDRTARPKG